MPDSRINELYGRYVERRLSREEEAELVELLTDPAAQREWRLMATLDARLHEELRGAAEAAPERRSIRWPVWAPLAAAAAVLAILGGLYFRPEIRKVPTYAMGRLTRAVGPLTIADVPSSSARITAIQTPSNSVCRLDQPDGTVVAVAGQSSLRWSEDLASGVKTLDVAAGQAYLDVASQKKPFQIRFPSGAQAEVLGTRLLANRSGPLDFVSVLKGNVKIQDGPTAVYVAAGQTASPGITSSSGLFTMIQGSAMPAALSWIDPVGVDSMRVSREAPGPIATKLSMLDLSRAEIQGGVWRLNRKGDDVVAIQEDPDHRGMALFGRREWIQGKYSCKVRILKVPQSPAPGEEPGIGLAFAYSSGGGVDMAGAARQLAPMLAVNPVLNMQADFEIRAAENTLHVRRLEFWPEGHRENGWRRDDWIRTPRDTQLVKERGPCALGVSTIGCSAEFFDVRLSNAVSATAAPAGDVRSAMGLIGRYDFRGVTGRSVPDSSGVAPAMDLTIGQPDMVERLAAGLRVRGAADIAARGDLPKIKQGWAKNKGLTLEIFAHPTVTDKVKAGGSRKLACLTGGDQSIAWIYDGGPGRTPEDRLYHFVFEFDDTTGKFVQHFYLDGQQAPSLRNNDVPWDFHRRPGSSAELSLAPSGNKSSITREPWEGDLVFMAVYDRVLQPEDVARLQQAGLPAPSTDAALWAWAGDYYRRHGQFIQQREKFSNGEVLGTVTPAQIVAGSKVEAGRSAKLVTGAAKDGKEAQLLSIENLTEKSYVGGLSIPGGLPAAFAVEFDVKPLEVLPDASKVSIDFDSHMTGTEPYQPAGLPESLAPQPLVLPSLSRGVWNTFRVEYVRVGRTPSGESIYEARFPATKGPGIFLIKKPSDMFALSVRGARVLLSEVRIHRLLPPANSELVLSPPPSK